MAKIKSSGSGMVITLVVFILLAIAGIGLSIHFYQQWRLAEQAIKANQSAFHTDIREKFDRAGWDFPGPKRLPYGIVYDDDHYRAVAGKLELAREYEDLRPLLPWRTESEVRRALQTYSPEGERFNLVERLLSYYSEQYTALKSEQESLNRTRQDLVRQLQDKDSDFREMQSEWSSRFEQLESNYADRLREFERRYVSIEAYWEDVREQEGAAFARLRDEADKLQSEVERAERIRKEKEQEVARLQEMLVIDMPEEIVPDGTVLAVEKEYDVIMVAGGKDAQRRRNERIVIYRELPDGEPLFIGAAVIARVFETTSMANLVEREIPVTEGQLFVRKRVWDQFDPVEVAVRTTETPETVDPSPVEETEPDHEPFDEPAEVEDDPFFTDF